MYAGLGDTIHINLGKDLAPPAPIHDKAHESIEAMGPLRAASIPGCARIGGGGDFGAVEITAFAFFLHRFVRPAEEDTATRRTSLLVHFTNILTGRLCI